jgi:hypothetical protein
MKKTKEISPETLNNVNGDSERWMLYFAPILGLILVGIGLFSILEKTNFKAVAMMVMGLFWLSIPNIRRSSFRIHFEEDGISYKKNILKRQKLMYNEISEAKQIANDFVFKNKTQEVRIPRKNLQPNEILFVEKKAKKLNKKNPTS